MKNYDKKRLQELAGIDEIKIVKDFKYNHELNSFYYSMVESLNNGGTYESYMEEYGEQGNEELKTFSSQVKMFFAFFKPGDIIIISYEDDDTKEISTFSKIVWVNEEDGDDFCMLWK